MVALNDIVEARKPLKGGEKFVKPIVGRDVVVLCFHVAHILLFDANGVLLRYLPDKISDLVALSE